MQRDALAVYQLCNLFPCRPVKIFAEEKYVEVRRS